MRKIIIAIFPVFLFCSIAAAESLYIESLKAADIGKKDLADAEKKIKSHKDIKIQSVMFVPSFHKQNNKSGKGKREICQLCHLTPPHTENERKRSFLNMHSRYISCTTCHFKADNIRLEYDWLDAGFSSANNRRKIIAPFYKEHPVTVFDDHPLSRKIKEIWQGNDIKKKAEMKARLHKPLDEKGLSCVDCHNKKSMLDFQALGYSKKESAKIQNNIIAEFFTRFKKDRQRLRMSDLLQ